MKTKGQLTREMIVHRAAGVFNRRGYIGTSISDLVAETGLQAGGIYNHFQGKADLALAAFDYAVAGRSARIHAAIDAVENAVDRLIAFAGVFLEMCEQPDLLGGCPILNTACEADDTDENEALKLRAQAAMQALCAVVDDILMDGIEQQTIRADIDRSTVVTSVISSLEGGMMMSQLYGDTRYLRRVVAFLTDYVNAQVRR